MPPDQLTGYKSGGAKHGAEAAPGTPTNRRDSRVSGGGASATAIIGIPPSAHNGGLAGSLGHSARSRTFETVR